MLARAKKGFTLLELIVVLLVIGILAAIAVPTYNTVKDNSAKRTLRSTAESIARDADAMARSNIDPQEAGDTTDAYIELALEEAGIWDAAPASPNDSGPAPDETAVNDVDLDAADPYYWAEDTNTLTYDLGSRCFELTIMVDTDGDGSSDTGTLNDDIDNVAIIENEASCS